MEKFLNLELLLLIIWLISFVGQVFLLLKKTTQKNEYRKFALINFGTFYLINIFGNFGFTDVQNMVFLNMVNGTLCVFLFYKLLK